MPLQRGKAGPVRRGTGRWRAARWARRAVQVAAFVVFVSLLFAGLQRLEPVPSANVFFRLDPLAGLATMLAARAWLAPFALALITLGLTLVLGRIWCGWICPLGTLLGWLRLRPARRLAGRMPTGLRSVKYVLLGAIIVLAALSNLTFLVLDPLSLLTRTMTTSVVPGFVYLADTMERTGMTWAPTVGIVQWADETLQVLGVAVIDRDRCLPWAADTPCIVCEEMCPVPEKAVVLGPEREVTRADGSTAVVVRPRVAADRCIGCGICEYKCPLEGRAAIVVVPASTTLAAGTASQS